jgi:hypothetical protein
MNSLMQKGTQVTYKIYGKYENRSYVSFQGQGYGTVPGDTYCASDDQQNGSYASLIKIQS